MIKEYVELKLETTVNFDAFRSPDDFNVHEFISP